MNTQKPDSVPLLTHTNNCLKNHLLLNPTSFTDHTRKSFLSIVDMSIECKCFVAEKPVQDLLKDIWYGRVRRQRDFNNKWSFRFMVKL
jgi:hypothetical protein